MPGLNNLFVFTWYMWLNYLFTYYLDDCCFVCQTNHHFISVRTKEDRKAGELKDISFDK